MDSIVIPVINVPYRETTRAIASELEDGRCVGCERKE